MDKKDLNKLNGSRNRAQGATLESEIEAACVFYRTAGVAAIDKTPEPMRVLYPMEAGRFVACFSKSAQPDFQGTLCNGRSVMFEAKTTRSGKLQQSVVTEEQGRYLDDNQRMGALCFVVCSFGAGIYAKVPWEDWKNLKEILGHKYISREEAAARWPIGYNRRGVLNFLAMPRKEAGNAESQRMGAPGHRAPGHVADPSAGSPGDAD